MYRKRQIFHIVFIYEGDPHLTYYNISFMIWYKTTYVNSRGLLEMYLNMFQLAKICIPFNSKFRLHQLITDV